MDYNFFSMIDMNSFNWNLRSCIIILGATFVLLIPNHSDNVRKNFIRTIFVLHV